MTVLADGIRRDYIAFLEIDELGGIDESIEDLLSDLSEKNDIESLEALKSEYGLDLLKIAIQRLNSVAIQHLHALAEGAICETQKFYFCYDNYIPQDWLTIERGSLVVYKKDLYYFMSPVNLSSYIDERNKEFHSITPINSFKDGLPPLLLEEVYTKRPHLAYLDEVSLWESSRELFEAKD